MELDYSSNCEEIVMATRKKFLLLIKKMPISISQLGWERGRTFNFFSFVCCWWWINVLGLSSARQQKSLSELKNTLFENNDENLSKTGNQTIYCSFKCGSCSSSYTFVIT